MFKAILAVNDLTNKHWEAARLAIRGAFQKNVQAPELGEPKEILKFLDYHLGLQGAGEDHTSSISFTLAVIHVESSKRLVNHPTVNCIRKFNCANPSFVRGVRSIMRPDRPRKLLRKAAGLVALISDQWFNSPVPVMEPEEMSEFCEHLTAFAIYGDTRGIDTRRSIVTILFGMLRSPDWRKHIATRLWSVFANCGLVGEESFRWCLRNAIELLEFMRGLPGGEGLKWWYVTLWFHYDKLDTVVRDEAERIAKDMSRSHGVTDLNLYLNLIGREVTKIRTKMRHWRSVSGSSSGTSVSWQRQVRVSSHPVHMGQGVYYAPSIGIGASSGSDASSGFDAPSGFDVPSGSDLPSGPDVSSESDIESSESDVDAVELI